MKKFLLILCLPFLLMGCSNVNSNEIISERSGITVEESITENLSFKFNDWQKAYKQVLLDFMNSDEYFLGNDIVEYSAFSIYDLNTDGMLELIISENTSHAAACRIYTYDNGLIYLGRIGAFGDIGYYEDNDMIVHYNIGAGIEDKIFCELENNEINMIATFYNDFSYRVKEQAIFKFNDTEITKDEYNIELEKYKGHKYISLGRDYSFDEIDDVLWE